MIIMINGAFGVGKTTIAAKLQEQIPNSMLFDPEMVGFLLREIIPEDLRLPHEKTDNFQDLQLWKMLVVEVAKLLKKQYDKHLIVPMAIYNQHYFQYIYEGFRNIDFNTYHFCLMASKETIFHRLRERGEEEGNWCFQQTEKCLNAFKDPIFDMKINTENVTIDDIVKKIKDKIFTN